MRGHIQVPLSNHHLAMKSPIYEHIDEVRALMN